MGYEIIGDYVNNKTPLTVRHLDCGKEFKVTSTNLRGGSRCPYCFNSVSLEENNFLEFINSISESKKPKSILIKRNINFMKLMHIMII